MQQLKAPYLDVKLEVPACHIGAHQLFDDFYRHKDVTLIGRTQDMVSISILNLHCEVALPAGRAEPVVAGHQHWAVPRRHCQHADLTL